MPELSLRPTLETDLQAAYERNVEAGKVMPDATQSLGATAAAAATVGQQRRRQQDQRESEERFAGLLPETWMTEELGEAAAKFDKYNGLFGNGDFAPPDVDDILNSKDFEVTTRRLHSAKVALYESGLENPDGEKIGDSMKIVLMPWQAFRNNLENLPAALLKLRKRQGIDVLDEIDPAIISAIDRRVAIYRVADGRSTNSTSYLESMITTHGAWGVALIQTSDAAGVKDLIGKKPDTLTGNGTKHLEIAGHNVGSLGIFEWLALTLQEDPEALSSHDSSWMLANRTYISGSFGSYVPEGSWDINGVRSGMNSSDSSEERSRPRLAVL